MIGQVNKGEKAKRNKGKTDNKQTKPPYKAFSQIIFLVLFCFWPHNFYTKIMDNNQKDNEQNTPCKTSHITYGYLIYIFKPQLKD